MATGLVYFLFEALGIGDPFTFAEICFNRNQFESAILHLEKVGDGKSQHAQAICYGLKSEEEKFRQFAYKSAISGYKGGLAACYIEGIGYDRNIRKGLALYRETAMDSDIFSIMSIAGYLTGSSNDPHFNMVDIVEGKKWLVQAAEKGNSLAKMMLKQL